MDGKTIGDLSVNSFARSYLLDALSRCTPEALDYRPQPPDGMRLYSLREQFLHIADIGELYVSTSILGEDLPPERWRLPYEGPGQWTVAGDWPDAGSIRLELEKSWAYQDQHIFNRPVSDLAALVGPADQPRILGEELQWLVFHESQHRGQVMHLLRMAGIEPPEW